MSNKKKNDETGKFHKNIMDQISTIMGHMSNAPAPQNVISEITVYLNYLNEMCQTAMALIALDNAILTIHSSAKE